MNKLTTAGAVLLATTSLAAAGGIGSFRTEHQRVV